MVKKRTRKAISIKLKGFMFAGGRTILSKFKGHKNKRGILTVGNECDRKVKVSKERWVKLSLRDQRTLLSLVNITLALCFKYLMIKKILLLASLTSVIRFWNI